MCNLGICTTLVFLEIWYLHDPVFNTQGYLLLCSLLDKVWGSGGEPSVIPAGSSCNGLTHLILPEVKPREIPWKHTNSWICVHFTEFSKIVQKQVLYSYSYQKSIAPLLDFYSLYFVYSKVVGRSQYWCWWTQNPAKKQIPSWVGDERGKKSD